MIKNQPIPRVRSFSCLGVELDESLEWNDHIEMICKKVEADIGISGGSRGSQNEL